MSDPLPPLSSKLTEPYITQVLGILWKRFNQSEKKEGNYRALWEGVRAVNLFCTVVTDGKTGVHAARACSNLLDKTAQFIEIETGINPFREWFI